MLEDSREQEHVGSDSQVGRAPLCLPSDTNEETDRSRDRSFVFFATSCQGDLDMAVTIAAANDAREFDNNDLSSTFISEVSFAVEYIQAQRSSVADIQILIEEAAV